MLPIGGLGANRSANDSVVPLGTRLGVEGPALPTASRSWSAPRNCERGSEGGPVVRSQAAAENVDRSLSYARIVFYRKLCLIVYLIQY